MKKLSHSGRGDFVGEITDNWQDGLFLYSLRNVESKFLKEYADIISNLHSSNVPFKEIQSIEP